jgi:hypothetical protein
MEVGEEVARALGAGFDLASDFRLRFAKLRRRLVDLDEIGARDVPVPGGGGAVLRGVPRDVGIDKGDRIRFRSDVLEFNQVRPPPARVAIGLWYLCSVPACCRLPCRAANRCFWNLGDWASSPLLSLLLPSFGSYWIVWFSSEKHCEPDARKYRRLQPAPIVPKFTC